MFFKRLFATIHISRAAWTAWAVWVGGEVGSGAFDVSRALVGALAAALISVSGTLLERALIPHQWIPETHPPGKLSRRAAAIGGILSAGFGCIFAALTGWAPLILALVAAAMLILFAVRSPKCILVGDLVPPAVGALAFIFGALVQGEGPTSILPHAWVAACFGALWLLAIQWIGGAACGPDDQDTIRRSLAFVASAKAACRAAAVTLWLIAALVWFPFARGLFDFTYLVLVGIGVFPLLAVTALYLWSVPDRTRLAQIARLLGFGLSVLVGAIWFGAH